MATEQLRRVVRYLRQTTTVIDESRLADGALLERFVRTSDELAFAVMVRRHGPMVLAVCRRVLHDLHDAEDAFQATFLVLVRKAADIRTRTSVGSWLHGVAYRIALKARAARSARRAHDLEIPTMTSSDPYADILWRDLRPVLDAEVQRLPEKYRVPVVLCYLEGVTYDEAARQIGCPKGTLAIRLARARERLRTNLTRRGVVLSATALAALLTRDAAASTVPSRLTEAVLTFAGSTALAVSSRVLALAQGVTMSHLSHKLVLALVITLGVIGAAPGLVSFPSAAENRASSTEPALRVSAPDEFLPLARRAWAILEIAEGNSLEPCSRQTLLLDGILAFAKEAKIKPPEDLKQRAEKLSQPDDFARLLTELKSKATQPAKITPQAVEKILLEGLLKRVAGSIEDLMTPQAIRIAEQLAGNRYVGIGIQIHLNKEEDRPEILNPFSRGTAYKAGIRPGDIIWEVEGKDTKHVPIAKIVEWLRGEEGTKVTVTIKQASSKEQRKFTMSRAKVPIPTVLGYRQQGEDKWEYKIDSNIGYVWIRSINSSTVHELRQIEQALRAEGVKGLVLDMRDSHGQGMLHHAELLAGAFLNGEVMWRARDAKGDVREFKAEQEGLFRDWPIVALINKSISDNAQGAVLAALQDAGRAVLVGETTSCTGYIRSQFLLPNEQGALLLRTGRFERTSSAGWPVKPQREVQMSEAQQKLLEGWQRQRELPVSKSAEHPIKEDPQLAAALSLVQHELQTRSTERK